jgi:serine/threonine-protein kinase SRK2
MHVLARREVFVTDDSVCFVMEYANGGNLFDLVRKQKRLRETQSRWFFQQLILAIDYCHRRGEAWGGSVAGACSR